MRVHRQCTVIKDIVSQKYWFSKFLKMDVVSENAYVTLLRVLLKYYDLENSVSVWRFATVHSYIYSAMLDNLRRGLCTLRLTPVHWLTVKTRKHCTFSPVDSQDLPLVTAFCCTVNTNTWHQNTFKEIAGGHFPTFLLSMTLCHSTYVSYHSLIMTKIGLIASTR